MSKGYSFVRDGSDVTGQFTNANESYALAAQLTQLIKLRGLGHLATERPFNQIKCYSLNVIQKLKILLIFCLVSGCNTVTGTVEGTSRGIIKDTKTIYHYSTCVFTKKQCGDLDLGD